jgi:Immunity protein 50
MIMKSIENAELIEKIFGGWPSFHDAEIHSILLTRDCDVRPRLEATIHHWQGTSEVDSNGYYVSIHHTLSTLRFSGVTDLKLADFNHQNVLWELEISESAEPRSYDRFSVSMPTSHGCEASFKCKEICVVSAVPYAKPCA